MADNSARGTESFAVAEKKEVKKKLRWAIVGCGGISGAHMEAIKQIPEIEVVAGCDILPERNKEFTEKWGVKDTYEKWDDLLANVKPDVVDVCTPNGVHAPAAIAASNAGCHVITEKPMSMSPAESQAMIDAAKANGKLLCTGFQYRYHPSCEMFVRAREAGDIGDIMFVKCQALRRRGIPNWGVFGQKHLQGGGPMIDIGVHVLEAAHYCMGEPTPIAASGNCWTYIGDKPSEVVSCWPNWDYKTFTVEDLAIGQIRFNTGALLQIEASFSAHIEHDVWNFQIMGTKGGFNWETATLFTDHAGTMVNCKAGFLPSVGFNTLFVEKLKNFAYGCLYGTPLRAPGESGMAVQKMLDGIYRSADIGHEVAIN